MTRQARRYRGRGLVAWTSRLSARPRLLGTVVAAVAAAMTYIIILSVNGVPFQDRHRIVVEVPPGTPPVNITDQVRIAGQRVGQVADTKVVGESAELVLNITPKYWPLGDQTTAKIRVRPGAGLRFVDLVPAGTGHMKDGATIPVERVSRGTTLTEIAEMFDRSTQQAISGTLVAGGSALAGQGEEINRLLDTLPVVLRKGTPLVDALTPEPGTLSGLLNDGAATARALSDSGDLPDLLASTADTTGAVANRRDDLAGVIDKSAPFTERLEAVGPRLQWFLGRVGALADDATPTVQALDRELPELRRLLAAGPTLSRATGQIGPAAAAALREAPAGIAALRGPVALIRVMTPTLEPILNTVLPYKPELQAGADAFYNVTSKSYPGGINKDRPALRTMLLFACAAKSNPLPDPGEAVKDRGEEGRCS